MSVSQRVQWIDACKGVGIFLVIIGHTMIDNNLRGQIYAFHMPLFFFISGYLFSIKKYPRFIELLISKCKSLLVPYISFAIISLVLLRFFLQEPINIKAFFDSLMYSRRNNIYFDDPLWFLTSLFTMEVIYFFVTKYVKNDYFRLFIVLATSFFAISSLDVLAGGNILPWSFDQTLYYILYFGLGQFIKNKEILGTRLRTSIRLIISSVVYIVLLIYPSIYPNVVEILNGILNLPSNLTTYIVTVSWAVVAILFIIYISQFLSSISLINFLGKNSLILLGLHISFGFNFINKVVLERLHLKINNPNLLGLAFTLGSIVLLIPICMFINNYIPFILGKNLALNNLRGKKDK
ncbi:acyltransferase family protein [Neobacillus sp. OS1-2]|uniref:acyltransferase family protein n=1 Tax=Neobacillus sp. OS1-2 TaxID=3070680 RepID=UPI0027DED02A|nr:acyltransferase family protein [Neobacillus sp. OS1-2]WML41199.1 acyltransferase family protein [Neobacillus sp. OS1-2]